MDVSPSPWCRRLISARISSRSLASRLDSGSSSSSTRGSITSARAMATRCCWPPDSCAGYRVSKPVSLTSASMRRTRSPPSQISPALGASSPASRLRAVDLPQHEGPRKVTNSPPRTSSAKSSRTFFAPKCLLSRKRRRPIIPLELLDALRADLPVPAVHGRDQLLHRQLRDDLVLLLHVRVLRPPVLGHELLDVGRRLVEGGRLDRRADEGLPRQHLLVGAPHELHEVEDDLLLGGRHALGDRPEVAVDHERRVGQDEDLRVGRDGALCARLLVPLHDAGFVPARALGELLERDGGAGRV